MTDLNKLTCEQLTTKGWQVLHDLATGERALLYNDLNVGVWLLREGDLNEPGLYRPANDMPAVRDRYGYGICDHR